MLSLTVSFITDCKFLQLVTIAGTAIWLTITLGGVRNQGVNENVTPVLRFSGPNSLRECTITNGACAGGLPAAVECTLPFAGTSAV